MKDIKWEGDKVCYAYGGQYADPIISSVLRAKDFQLNEIRQGDYIPKSELNTEQKYNDAVEVFVLFGFPHYDGITFKECESSILVADEDGDLAGQDFTDQYCKRQLTYQQLITIGKLKRAMIERDEVLIDAVVNTSILKGTLGPAKDYTLAGTIEGESTKESRAYNILESMNIFYDEEKEKWYKKEYL